MMLKRGEMNATTAPTFLQLHEDADQVAKVAYKDSPKELDRHEKWHDVQKKVLLAGQGGVDNSQLPESPERFFSSTPEEQDGFMRAMAPGAADRVKGKDETGAGPSGPVRAQDLLPRNEPPVRGGHTSQSGEPSENRNAQDKPPSGMSRAARIAQRGILPPGTDSPTSGSTPEPGGDSPSGGDIER